MSTTSEVKWVEDAEEEQHKEITCCLALKYYLGCYCCCPNRIVPVVPITAEKQSIASESINEDVLDKIIETATQLEHDEKERKRTSRFKFRVAGKLARFAAFEEVKQAAAAKRKGKFKSTGKLVGIIASHSVGASHANLDEGKSRQSFLDVGKMAQLGLKASKKPNQDQSIEELPDEATTSKKKGWRLRSIGKLGWLRGRGSSPKKNKPKVRKSFKTIGKITQLGVTNPKKLVKTEAIDNSSDEDEIPKKKSWGFKSIGKMSWFRGSSPEKKKPKTKKSFSEVGKMTKMTVQASRKSKKVKRDSVEKTIVEEILRDKDFGPEDDLTQEIKRRRTLKTVGHIIKLGAAAKKKNKQKIFTFKSIVHFIRYGTRRPPKQPDEESNSSDSATPSPPVRKTSFKVISKLAKLGFGARKISNSAQNGKEDGQRKEKKKKGWTFKSLGLFTRVGTQTKKPRKIKKRKSFKVVSKITKLGAAVSKTNKGTAAAVNNKPPTFEKSNREDQTLKSAKVSNSGASVSKMPKTKHKWTFKNLAKAAQIVAVIQENTMRSQKRKKKGKLTLKFVSKFIILIPDDSKTVCTCERTSYNSDIIICTCSDYFDTDEE